jgi:hypothetical protein
MFLVILAQLYMPLSIDVMNIVVDECNEYHHNICLCCYANGEPYHTIKARQV